jgi:hypothetical protein
MEGQILEPPSLYGQPSDDGPLIAAYDAAKTAGTLTVGSYDQFVELGGVAIGASGWTVALIDEDTSTSLKVAGKLAPRRGLAGTAAGPADPLPGNLFFEGGEHTAIGDSILLSFTAVDPGTPAYKVPLTLANGLQLTYGQILALGGDFYGVPDAPISDGTTAADRMTRFTNAYNTLAVTPASVAEAGTILQIMQREITAVNAALNQGQPASGVYDELGDALNKAWNVATGGGSFVSDLIPPGRYLDLATTNWDHFGTYAVLAYQAGHAVALAQAIVAHGIADPVQAKAMLTIAYAMNAFADHFLSDLFSAGHIRDPRKEIYTTSTVGLSANLCAKGMHDEDCKYGLIVSNQLGNNWRAYGDKRYFDTVNLQNMSLVDEAVQYSATEIFSAFLNGTQPVDPANYMGLALAPNLAQVMNYQTNPLGNFVPLLVLNNGAVQNRDALNDLNAPGWSAPLQWATLAAKLHSSVFYHPNQPAAYVGAPDTAPAISPNGWGSTNPIPPNWVAGNQVRYFVSVFTANFESSLSPACPWYTLSNQFQPTVVNVPTGPGDTIGRRIYREFLNKPIQYCGSIGDNTTTSFQDLTP